MLFTKENVFKEEFEAVVVDDALGFLLASSNGFFGVFFIFVVVFLSSSRAATTTSNSFTSSLGPTVMPVTRVGRP